MLRVGPSPVVPQGQQNIANQNQTIRLQTVPAVSRFTGPPLALRKTIVTQQQVKPKANVNENQLKYSILLLISKKYLMFNLLKVYFSFVIFITIFFFFGWNEYFNCVGCVIFHFFFQSEISIE